MEESRIYLYDCDTDEEMPAIEGKPYIAGSHNSDWAGILVEKVVSTGTSANDVYIKDCHILLAIDDFGFTKNYSSVDIEADDIVIAGRNKPFSVDNPGNYTGIFITLCTYYIYNYSNYYKDKKRKLSKEKLITIDNYILDNLTSNITSMELADLLNISNYSLMKEFKRQMNMAPSKYVLKIKYDLAKQLLVTTDQTVTEIATSMGFFDNSHFTNFFKRRAGLTPNHYRKKYKLNR